MISVIESLHRQKMNPEATTLNGAIRSVLQMAHQSYTIENATDILKMKTANWLFLMKKPMLSK